MALGLAAQPSLAAPMTPRQFKAACAAIGVETGRYPRVKVIDREKATAAGLPEKVESMAMLDHTDGILYLKQPGTLLHFKPVLAGDRVLMMKPINPYSLVERYDKFKDFSVISIAPAVQLPCTKRYSQDLKLGGNVLFKGQTITPDALVQLRITSLNHDWVYLGYRGKKVPLTLLLDGKRTDLQFDIVSSDVFSGGTCYEALACRVSRDTLLKLGSAETVEGQLGINEFIIPSDGKAILLELASKLPAKEPVGGE